MITMEEYTLVAYGTPGSDPRENHAANIQPTIATDGRNARFTEVIRVEFSRLQETDGPQLSSMTRLRSVLIRMFSLGISLVLRSTNEGNDMIIRTVDDLKNVDSKAFFQRVPDRRAYGNFPDKVFFTLDTQSHHRLATFKQNKELMDFMKNVARIHMHVHLHQSHHVVIAGHLFMKSSEKSYTDGIRVLLEQYVNKSRSPEEQKTNYAFLEIDGRRVNQRIHESDPPRYMFTVALQIRCDEEHYPFVSESLRALNESGMDKHLFGKFLPNQSTQQMEYWVSEHNQYNQDLVVIRIVGLHPEVLEEPLQIGEYNHPVPIVQILYDAKVKKGTGNVIPATVTKKDGMIIDADEERLIDSIEPSRRSLSTGEYFVFTTQAKRAATLDHLYRTMSTVRIRSSAYRHHLPEENFQKGIVIPQSRKDEDTSEISKYMQSITPSVPSPANNNTQYHQYKPKKPPPVLLVFDDGVSEISESEESSRRKQAPKPFTPAPVPKTNAWNIQGKSTTPGSVGTESESMANSFYSMQSQLSTMTSVMTDLRTALKASEELNNQREQARLQTAQETERRLADQEARIQEQQRTQHMSNRLIEHLFRQNIPNAHEELQQLYGPQPMIFNQMPNNTPPANMNYHQPLPTTTTEHQQTTATPTAPTQHMPPPSPRTGFHQAMNNRQIPIRDSPTTIGLDDMSHITPTHPGQNYTYGQHMYSPHQQYPQMTPMPPMGMGYQQFGMHPAQMNQYHGHPMPQQVPNHIYHTNPNPPVNHPTANTQNDNDMSVAFTEDPSVTTTTQEHHPDGPPGPSGPCG